MAFYMSPPGGNISLQKLTQYAIARFNFLCQIYETGGDRIQIFDIVNNTDTVAECECLIEGSVKDKLSHFILRLICSCDEEMSSFFLKAERLLFDFRFSNMTEDELCRLFKSVDRFMKNMDSGSNYTGKMCKQVPQFIRNFTNILSVIKNQSLKWRNAVRMYLNGEDRCFMVPFQTVLQFVAKRQVNIKSGLALVPFCKLREVITSQFHEFLTGALHNVKRVFHTEDERMILLIKTLKVMFRQRFGQHKKENDVYITLSHTDIDDVIHMFPPCMSQLHHTLKQTHRLKHHSRVQYSLFLKEAGLPVHEALMFWRKEYSQAPSKDAGCSHDWSKNERRYTYNIRHLYGLEGSRINYRGHSCQALQECYNGPQDVGGCPFRHYDSTNLHRMLHAHGITMNMKQILQSAVVEQYSHACSLYLQETIQQAVQSKSSLKDTLIYDRLKSQSECLCVKHGCCSDQRRKVTNNDQEVSSSNMVSGADQKVTGCHQEVSNGNHKVTGCNQEVSTRIQEVSGCNQEVSTRIQEVSGCNLEVSSSNQKVMGCNQVSVGVDELGVPGRNSGIDCECKHVENHQLDEMKHPLYLDTSNVVPEPESVLDFCKCVHYSSIEKRTDSTCRKCREIVESHCSTDLTAGLCVVCVSKSTNNKVVCNPQIEQQHSSPCSLLSRSETSSLPGNTGKSLPDNTGKSLPGGTGKSLPGNTGKSLPGGTGKSLPGNTGKSLPDNTGKSLPGGTGKSLPGYTGKSLPGNTGKSLPGYTGKHLVRVTHPVEFYAAYRHSMLH